MITRRKALAGLAALPAALEVARFAAAQNTIAAPLAAPAQTPASAAAPNVLGSTVFHWNDLKPVKNAHGEVRAVCKQPTATLDQLEMHITTLNAGEMPHPPHTHVNEELIVLREGEVEAFSNGKWVRVEPGSIVFNASNVLHGLRNVGTTAATYHVVNISPDKAHLKI